MIMTKLFNMKLYTIVTKSINSAASVNYQLSTAIYYRPFPYRLSTTACAVRLRKINGFTFSLERGAVGARLALSLSGLCCENPSCCG